MDWCEMTTKKAVALNPIPSRLSFGGHESFPFRLGWIRKGVKAVAHPNAFNAEDAVVRLGVGKNMVKSIRAWCLATQMLEEGAVTGTSRIRPLTPSTVARIVFSEQGDPYLEDPASLWLLHWLLITNPDRMSLWRIAFMYSRENEFTKSDLVSLVKFQGEKAGQMTEDSAIGRDVDVFVRTYVAGRASSTEEDFSCPLTELGLISSGGGDRYAFVVGPKRTLPARVFGFAFLQYLRSKESRECSLSDATYYPGSPGQAFKLDEDSVVAYLRELAERDPSQWLVDVDGPIRRVGTKGEISPAGLLEMHYLESLG